MSRGTKSIAWWAKLLAVFGFLCLLDSCADRSSQEVTVIGKEMAELGFRGEGDSFQLNAQGAEEKMRFLVSAGAYRQVEPEDQIRVHQSLILGRYRGVAKDGEEYSDLSFWNILLFFAGIALFLPLLQGLLLFLLRRLFGRWMPGL